MNDATPYDTLEQRDPELARAMIAFQADDHAREQAGPRLQDLLDSLHAQDLETRDLRTLRRRMQEAAGEVIGQRMRTEAFLHDQCARAMKLTQKLKFHQSFLHPNACGSKSFPSYGMIEYRPVYERVILMGDDAMLYEDVLEEAPTRLLRGLDSEPDFDWFVHRPVLRLGMGWHHVSD